MDKLEYGAVQQQLIFLVGLVHDMPLGEFLAAIERADTLGSITDPSLWMQGQGQMMQVKRLAEELVLFQGAAVEFVRENVEKGGGVNCEQA